YVESGGQVGDTGTVQGKDADWEIRIDHVRKPAAGVIVHSGEVLRGTPKTGDAVVAAVDQKRRKDIARNHTATHLLHAALHEVLGKHARQAGSLVAANYLRFDFTHPEGLTVEEIDKIEHNVNQRILNNWHLKTEVKSLQQAKAEGAMALFGEKYGEEVRTITIGDDPFSYELCGGTHVQQTNDIGLFLIISESSAAAGIRRIEAVTGQKAYDLVLQFRLLLRESASMMGVGVMQTPEKVSALLAEINQVRKEAATLRQNLVASELSGLLDNPASIGDIKVLTASASNADADTLRRMADQFRQKHPEKAVAVLASIVDGKPMLIAAVTEDLVKRGFHAGDLVKFVAQPLGGGGGGKPTLAQAGGKDATKLDEALQSVHNWVKGKLG
ncbi:MAG: DHHA1 domain-containing protein, partial [Chloroflexota bacterium]